MGVIPAGISRTSESLRWQLMTDTLGAHRIDSLRLQRQLSTGERVSAPSEDAVAARLIMALNDSLEQSAQHLTNVQQGTSRLQATDSALADFTDLIRQAQSLGEQESSAPADADTRRAAAAVVDSLIDSLLAIANRRHGGRFLFGGSSETEAPFTSLGSTIHYAGDDVASRILAGAGQERVISVSGAEALGAWNGMVDRGRDLDPVIAYGTRLADLNGGAGVTTGPIIVSDGTTETTVDLSLAQNVYDVIHMLDAALPDTTTVSIDVASNALNIASSVAGANITVQDVPGGATAQQLGIETSSSGIGGDTLVGGNLDPLLTPLTSLADLANGGYLDLTSGFVITNGQYSATVDLSTAVTVEDVMNAINASGAYVRAQIAPEGNQLQVVSELSGAALTIGENGGDTAYDLGLRTMDPATALADLNRGRGVSLSESGPDLVITFRDGTTADVSLTGAETVQDVLDAIGNAALGRIDVRLTATGNGIRLEDLTAGAGTFSIANASGATAAGELGIGKSTTGAVILGDDVNPIVAANPLTDLLELREALLTNDGDGVTAAATRLAADASDVVGVRASVGARMNGLEIDQTWLEDQRLVDQELLSVTRDLDYPTALAQFATLNTLLEAALRTSASVSQVSLLDYL